MRGEPHSPDGGSHRCHPSPAGYPTPMELLADYLTYRRGCPNNGLRPSRNSTYLYILSGGTAVRGLTWHLQNTRPYWDAFINADGGLRAWLESPQAFQAPATWFDDAPFPDHLTPHDFACDVLPPYIHGGGYKKYATPLYNNWLLGITEGLHELAAYAHGWPITPPERDLARRAAHALMTKAPFVAYALADTSVLPMAHCPDKSYIHRVASKERLDKNPLSMSTILAARNLPEWCQTPKQLMDLCPPRTRVAGSTKYPYCFAPEGT